MQRLVQIPAGLVDTLKRDEIVLISRPHVQRSLFLIHVKLAPSEFYWAAVRSTTQQMRKVFVLFGFIGFWSLTGLIFATLFSQSFNEWQQTIRGMYLPLFAFVFLCKCGMARCRCAECLWSAVGPVDYIRIWLLFVRSQLFDRHASSLGDDPDNVCPGLDLSCCGTMVNNLEVRSARSGRCNNSVVGRQLAIRNLRSEDPIWACLRWLGRGDRPDGVDGNLCDAFLCWCGLELRKRHSGRLRLHHRRKNIRMFNAAKGEELRLYRPGPVLSACI